MKMKDFFLVFFLWTTSMILHTSCSRGSDSSVEYWKFHLGERWLVDGKSLKEEYLQNRFKALAPSPDEYQRAYYFVAAGTIIYKNIYIINDDDKMRSLIKETVEKANKDNFLLGMTQNAKLDMKSNPELYIENACKIIGPIEELKKEVASHVDVKEVERGTVADFVYYNVLYSIDEKFYIICCITEKGNGQSELQQVYYSKSINKVLDYWQAMHL